MRQIYKHAHVGRRRSSIMNNNGLGLRCYGMFFAFRQTLTLIAHGEFLLCPAINLFLTRVLFRKFSVLSQTSVEILVKTYLAKHKNIFIITLK